MNVFQPDLHHEGPLTKELIHDLQDKILSAIREVKAFVPPDNEPIQDEWEWCKDNWVNALEYAGLRCAAILTKLDFNIEHRQDEDHKCVDITLCILRDFENAKALGFQLPLET